MFFIYTLTRTLFFSETVSDPHPEHRTASDRVVLYHPETASNIIGPEIQPRPHTETASDSIPV